MPSSSVEPVKTQLYQLIESHYPNISLMVLPRKNFNGDTGKLHIFIYYLIISHIPCFIIGLDCIRSFALDEDRATLLLGLHTK